MSGRDRGQLSNAMGKIKDKIMRTVSDKDDTTHPQSHGYHRVQTGDGTLSTSTTATSLDTILIDDTNNMLPPPPPTDRHRSPMQYGGQQQYDELSFNPILELDDAKPVNKSGSEKQLRYGPSSLISDQKTTSKNSLKSSKVSFENPPAADSSDEDSFEDKRDQFQQAKTVSIDRKGILKDLKHILANENRKAFQSKKHVSLDIKAPPFLEGLLKASSSDEEFKQNRKDFQGRKHQSLDPRVSFKLEKELTPTSSSDDDDVENRSLIHDRFDDDITKPVIIDLRDFESDDEDLISTRKSFQQQRSISIESRKSIRFFEMDDMGSKKSENLRNTIPYVRQITEDGKPKLEVYRPTTNPIYIYTQVLAALSVSLGSMVVGFSSAYTSPALVSMSDRNITSFEVTPHAGSWVGGLMPLAGLAGGICGGPLIEYLGRKNTILATAIPFIVSWLLIACATNIGMVLAGRSLAGFCVGIASLSLPVYLGETVQPEVRGTLGLLPTAFGNIGILLCFVAGTYMDWSKLAFLGGVLPVPFLILMLLIPETPRWYVSRGREERARKALVWLRGKEADVEPELKGIIRSHSEAERHSTNNSMFELLKRSNLKPLAISLGLMFFQQLSGINAVIFYTVTIFKDAGSSIDGNLCTIIVGIVNFIATFIATVLIDRLGRKILLYISDVAMIITLFTLGGYFYAKNTGIDVSNIGWLPLSCFVIFVVGFSLGFGPIPWLMMGEILPGRIRGSAASVATAFNWACTFIVTKTFNDLCESIGNHGAFWLFGSICFIGLFFVIFYVPETQGKTLEDIERKMMGRVRRMSSVANIKPLSFNM